MAFGRRGPNISQFLRELHENPVLDEFPAVDDQDLSMFTNTEFFDLETGQNTDFQPPPAEPRKPESDSSPASDVVTPLMEEVSPMNQFAGLEFMTGDFSFNDFHTAFPSPSLPSFSEGVTAATSSGSAASSLQPIQPGPQQVYSQANGNAVGTVHGAGPRLASADKRQQTRSLSFEDQTRLAAEEDKRRRNTAASARFRVKKKQREQALEKSAKEMAEKVAMLEARISQLETENKWLKGIVLEKNSGNEEFLTKLLEDYKTKHALSKTGDASNGAPINKVSEEEETHDSSG